MIPKELKSARPLSGKERLGANRDSEYLGAEDIEPGIEPILTIAHIYNAVVTLQRGKERKDVITFREERVPGINNVRPLIVNATNRKTLRKLYGAVDADTLEGKRIQLYLDHNVRDPSTGDKVDGIRIKPRVPTAPRAEPLICEKCGKPITGVGKYSAEDVAEINEQRFGEVLCADCSRELSNAAASAAKEEQGEDAEPNDD